MAIHPRIMIVSSLCTFHDEDKQRITLSILDRADSEEFRRRFPDGETRENVADIQAYTMPREIYTLGDSNASFGHKRSHELPGTKYHLGDIIAEREAFDFGYVEPHIDTVALRIVDESLKGGSREERVARLRAQGLISEQQTAVYVGGNIEIISNEREPSFLHGPRFVEQNNKSHPITLMVYEPRDGARSIGVAFLVPEQNTIYEFMTSLPVEEKGV